MKIVHIIPTLEDGGAEATLQKICCFDERNRHIVICLISGGKHQQSIEDKGVKVHVLGLRKFPYITPLISLYRLVSWYKPDVVQTWMYHADFIGGILGKLAGCKRIVWNVRHSCLSLDYTKRRTIILAKICAILSKFVPDDIIYCGNFSKNEHLKIGYNSSLFKVIPNGYDFSTYKPQSPSDSFNLNLPIINKSYIRFGKLARYTPEKNHTYLIESFAPLKDKIGNFYLFLAGKGIDYDNELLVEKIRYLNLSDNVLLLGQLDNSVDFMNFIDVNVQSSSSEGFPNVLVEALACGTPCIATDVGDTQYILDETSTLVSHNDKNQLTDAAFDFAYDFCRERFQSRFNPLDISDSVGSKYGVETMLERYNYIWTSNS